MDLILLLAAIAYCGSTIGYFGFLWSQKQRFASGGLYFIILGCVFSTIYGLGNFFSKSELLFYSLQGNLIMVSWALAIVFIFTYYRFRIKVLGVFAAPLITCIVCAALPFGHYSPAKPSNFNDAWVAMHVGAIFIGIAMLALAFGTGCLYLLQERAIKNKKPGFFFKRLPSLELLDSTGYGCISVGFTLLTIGLIAGFMYSKTVWGHFLSFDPKEILSVITWLIYAALIHQRLAVGWRGRQAAVMAIVGFVFVLFTFIGANFFLNTHHKGFTQF